MFNIDWDDIAKKVAGYINANHDKNLVSKIKADIYLIELSSGKTCEEAWKEAEEKSKFFADKIL
jgi:hypothetical protein